MAAAESTLQINLETKSANDKADALAKKVAAVGEAVDKVNKDRSTIKIATELGKFSAQYQIDKIQSQINKVVNPIKVTAELRFLNAQAQVQKIQTEINKITATSPIKVNATLVVGNVSQQLRTLQAEIDKQAPKIQRSMQNAVRPTINMAAINAERVRLRQREREYAASAQRMNEVWQSAANDRTRIFERQIRDEMSARAQANNYLARTMQSSATQAKTQITSNPAVSKQASLTSGIVSSSSDINAIMQQGKEVEKAWGDVYKSITAQAKESYNQAKALSADQIQSLKTATDQRIAEIKRETALTKDEQNKLIALAKETSANMISEYKKVPDVTKAAWAETIDMAKEAKSVGIAAAKDEVKAKLALIAQLKAAELTAIRETEAAQAAKSSHIQLLLEGSSRQAKALSAELAKVGDFKNYDSIKGFKDRIDELTVAFGKLQLANNSALSAQVQTQLSKTYETAAKASEAFSNNKQVEAARFVSDTDKEIKALSLLLTEITSTNKALNSSTGRSQLADQLHAAALELDVLKAKFNELGSYSKFDSITKLQSQIESVSKGIANVGVSGAKENVRVIGLQADAMRALDAAAIAAGKNQGFAFMDATAKALQYKEQLDRTYDKLTEFSRLKVQTDTLKVASENDAKKAIEAAKEVKRVKISAIDEEIARLRSSLTERQLGNDKYMSAFEAVTAKIRAEWRRTIDDQYSATVEGIKRRLAVERAAIAEISRLDQTNIAGRRQGNADIASRLAGRPYESAGTNVQAAPAAARAEIEHLNVTGRVHESIRRQMGATDATYFANLLKHIVSLSAALYVAQAAYGKLVQAFESVKEAAITSQKMTTVMTVITGSAKEAREQVEWLRHESNKLGLSFEDAATPFAKFAAAAKGMFSTEEVKGMFTQLGRVSVAMHLTGTETKGVFLAIQQMASKGKISLEELRLQFAERIPGAMTIAADSMGMTMTDFVKKVSNGQMMTEDFLKKFLKALDEEFGQAADAAGKGLIGAIARYQNAIFGFWEQLGDAGVADAIGASATRIANFLNGNKQVIDEWGKAFAKIIGGATDKLMEFLSSPTALDSMLVFFESLSKIIMTTVSAINTLVAAIDSMPGTMLGGIAGAIGGGLAGGVPGAAVGLGAGLAAGAYADLMDSATSKRKDDIAEAKSLGEVLAKIAENQNKVISDQEFTEERATKAWAKYVLAVGTAEDKLKDFYNAANIALKPDDVEGYVKNFDSLQVKIDETVQKLKDLDWKSSSWRAPELWTPGAAAGQARDYIASGAKKELDDAIAKASELETLLATTKRRSGEFGVSKTKEIENDLKSAIATRDALQSKYDAANKVYIEAQKQRTTLESQLAETVNAQVKSAEKLDDEYGRVVDRMGDMRSSLDKLMSKQADYKAMSLPQLTSASEENRVKTITSAAELDNTYNKIQALNDEIKSIEAKQKELNDASYGVKRIVEAKSAVAALGKSYDDLNRSATVQYETWKKSSAALDEMITRTYKLNNQMYELARNQASKVDINQMVKGGDAKGLATAYAEAGDMLERVNSSLDMVKSKLSSTNTETAEGARLKQKELSLLSDQEFLQSRMNDLGSAQIQIENQKLKLVNDQIDAAKTLAGINKDINEMLGQDVAYSEMSYEQLRKAATSKEFVPSIVLKPTVDTDAAKRTMEQVKSDILGNSDINVTVTKGVSQTTVPASTVAASAPSGKLSSKGLSAEMLSAIRAAAAQANVPENFIKAILKHESGFNPSAKGPTGDVGIAQFIPKTARGYGLTVNGQVDERLDWRKSIAAMGRLVGDLNSAFKGNLSLVAAGYNAGPGRILKTGRNPVPQYSSVIMANKAKFDAGEGIKPQVSKSIPIKIEAKDSKTLEFINKTSKPLPITADTTEATGAIKQFNEQAIKGISPVSKAYYTLMQTIKEKQALEADPKAKTDKRQVQILEDRLGVAKKEFEEAMAYVKALKDQGVEEYNINNALINRVMTLKEQSQIEQLIKRKGANAETELAIIYAQNAARADGLKDELKKEQSHYNSAAIEKDVLGNLMSEMDIRNARTKSIEKQAQLTYDIARAEELQSKAGEGIISSKEKVRKILEDQVDQLKLLQDGRLFGEKGVNRLKMKVELGVDSKAFQEWDLREQQIQLEQYFAAAGFGIDSVSTEFSNAFRQMAIDGKSFTDAIGDMFQGMIDRMLSASMDLMTSNLFQLISGQGGSWGQLLTGVVGTGIGLASKYLTSKPKQTPSPAAESKAYGSGATHLADQFSRTTAFDTLSASAVTYNQTLESLTSVLRNNTSIITDWIGSLGSKIAETTIGAAIKSVFEPVTATFSTMQTMWSGATDWLTTGLTKLVSPITNLFTSGAAKAGEAAATTIADKVTSSWSQGILAQQTSRAGIQQATDAAGSKIPTASNVGVVLSVLKYGWDLFNIASQKGAKVMDQVSASLWALGDTLLSVGLSTMNIPVLIAAAAVNIGTSLADGIANGFNRENIGRLFFGMLGKFILPTRVPNTWMNTFNPTTAEAPKDLQGKAYDFSSVSTVYIDGKEVKLDANKFYESTGNKSATRGVVTPFGATQISIHEVKGAKTDNLKESYDPLLKLIATIDSGLASTMDRLDAKFGESGKSMAYYSEQLGNNLDTTRVATKQNLEDANYAESISKRYNWIINKLAESGSQAGKVIKVWYDVFTSKFEEVTKDSANMVLGIMASLTTATTSTGSMSGLEALAQFPIELADLVMKSVTAVKKGGDPNAVMNEIMKVVTSFMFLQEGLAGLKIAVPDKDIAVFLTGLNSIGYAVDEGAKAIAGYASIFVKVNKRLIESLDPAAIGRLFTEQFNEFDKLLSKAGISDAGRRTAAIGSASVVAGMVSGQGISINQNQLVKFATDLDAAGVKASQAAKDVIDHTIATEGLTKVTRDSAIATLVKTGKLKEETIAEADTGAAIAMKTKDLISAMGFVQTTGAYVGKTLGEMKFSADTWVNAAKNVVEVFGSLEKAAEQFDNVAKRALKPTEYAQGQVFTAAQRVAALKEANPEFKDWTAENVRSALLDSKAIKAWNEELAKGVNGKAKPMLDMASALLDEKDARAVLNDELEKAVGNTVKLGDTIITSTDAIDKAFGSFEQALRSITSDIISFASDTKKPSLTRQVASAQMVSIINNPRYSPLMQSLGITGSFDKNGVATTNAPDRLAQISDTYATNPAKMLQDSAALAPFLSDPTTKADYEAFKSANESYKQSLKDESTANEEAAKAHDDYLAKLKDANDFLKSVNDELYKLTHTDFEGKMLDIKNGILDMMSQAREKGTSIPTETLNSIESEQIKALVKSYSDPLNEAVNEIISDNPFKDVGTFIRDNFSWIKDAVSTGAITADKGAEESAKVVKVAYSRIINAFKDINDEFDQIGKSDLAKNILGIGEFLNKNIADAFAGFETALAANPANESALRTGLNTQVAKIQAVAVERVKLLFKGINDEFEALGRNSDITSIQLWLTDQQQGLLELYTKYPEMQAYAMEQNSKVLTIAWNKVINVFKDVNAEFEQIGLSDSQKSVAEIKLWLKGMNDAAQQSVGMKSLTGETISQKTADLQVSRNNAVALNRVKTTFKDVVDELRNIGKTDYSKSLDAITEWTNNMVAVAPEIALAYNVTTDQALAGIYAVRDARIKSLNEELETIKSKAATDTARLNASDFEQQLWSLRDSFVGTIEQAANAGAKYSDIIQLASNGTIQAGNLLLKAKEQITKNFEGIYKSIAAKRNELSDKLYEAQGGKDLASIQRQRALADLESKNFDDQMAALNTLQELAMSRYEKEISAIKDLTSFIDQLKLDSNLSPLSPEQKVAESRRMYVTASAGANIGNSESISAFESASKDYLTQMRDYYGTNSDYAAAFDEVIKRAEELKGGASVTTEQKIADATASTVAELKSLQDVLNNIEAKQRQAQSAETQKLVDAMAKVGQDFYNALQKIVDKLEDPSKKELTFDISELIVTETAKEQMELFKKSIIDVLASGTLSPSDAKLVEDSAKDYIVTIAGLITNSNLSKSDTEILLDSGRSVVKNLSDLVAKGKIDPSEAAIIYASSVKFFKNLANLVDLQLLTPDNATKVYKAQTELLGVLSQLIIDSKISKSDASLILSSSTTLVESIGKVLKSGTVSDEVINGVYQSSGLLVASVLQAIDTGRITGEDVQMISAAVTTFTTSISTAISDVKLSPSDAALYGNALTTMSTTLSSAISSQKFTPEMIGVLALGLSEYASNPAKTLGALNFKQSDLDTLNAALTKAAGNPAATFAALGFSQEDYDRLKGGLTGLSTNTKGALSSQTLDSSALGIVSTGILNLANNMKTGLSDVAWLSEPGTIVQTGITTLAGNISSGLTSIGVDNSPIYSAVQSLMNTIASQVASAQAQATTAIAAAQEAERQRQLSLTGGVRVSRTDTTSTVIDPSVLTPVATVANGPGPGKINVGGIWMDAFADGGVTNKPSIFGDNGWEAAVPLDGNRSIPVTLKGGADNEAMIEELRAANNALKEQNALLTKILADQGAIHRENQKAQADQAEILGDIEARLARA